MNQTHSSRQRGFTLLETVIAIGVLAVLLTGFMVVFAPAADGIRKSIDIQQADRLASTLERELVTPRQGEKTFSVVQEPLVFATGFEKAFFCIRNSAQDTAALLVYQYRGSTSSLREDKTPTPVESAQGIAGTNYVVVPMVRRRSDPILNADLAAVEGAVYLVKCTQLVFDAGALTLSTTPEEIKNPKPNSTPPDPAYKSGPFTLSNDYPEAVIAFSAEFHQLPSRSSDYISGKAFTDKFGNVKNPVFTRNLAVRR